MKSINITALCNYNIDHYFKADDLLDWVTYVSVDHNGDVWGWEDKPGLYSGYEKWMLGDSSSRNRARKVGSMNEGDDNTGGKGDTFPGWKSLVWPVRFTAPEQETTGPYVNKKINWIKDVKACTGVGLIVAKFAVDCAIESGRRGTQKDFIETVKFGNQGNDERYFSMGGTEQGNACWAAVTALEKGEPPASLTTFTLEYWGDKE